MKINKSDKNQEKTRVPPDNLWRPPRGTRPPGWEPLF